jgi:hypothetical protein
LEIFVVVHARYAFEECFSELYAWSFLSWVILGSRPRLLFLVSWEDLYSLYRILLGLCVTLTNEVIFSPRLLNQVVFSLH